MNRVADPVHFRPDPDNQNSKIGSRSGYRIPDPDPRSYWHLKNQFKHLHFFHIKHISSDFLMITWKCVKPLFLFYFFALFLQLYVAKVPIGSGSGENFPDQDPSKKVRIRKVGRFNVWWIRFTFLPTAETVQAMASPWLPEGSANESAVTASGAFSSSTTTRPALERSRPTGSNRWLYVLYRSL